MMKASAVRMAGYLIALMHDVTLEPVFVAMVESDEWKALDDFEGKSQIEEVVLNGSYFKQAAAVACSVGPVPTLPRLSDQPVNGMPLLCYY
jgi:hypothetical protein